MTVTTDLELCRFINESYHEQDVIAFTRFSQQMFNSVLSTDLQTISTPQRYQIALLLWQSFCSRSANENKVTIENRTPQDALALSSVIHIITDDKAFIVDSVSALLMAYGYKINVFLHPVVKRNQILASNEKEQDTYQDESILYIELASQLAPKVIGELVDTIQNLLADITKVTQDWPLMMAKCRSINHESSDPDAIDAQQFLSWLCNEHFVFIGYNFIPVTGGGNAIPLIGSLGVFNDDVKANNPALTLTSAEFKQFIAEESLLKVSKSLVKSTIHRYDYLDLVSVKEFSTDGKLIAIHQFSGLFTQIANNLHPNKIPLLNAKLAQILQQLSLKSESHDYRSFMHILAVLPKRELYESSNEQLLDLAQNIHNLNVRSKSGVFIRENSFDEQVSVLVFVSKDAFCTDLRDEIEGELSSAYQGEILSRRSMLNDNYLAQWHFIVKKSSAHHCNVDVTSLIARIETKAQSWNENLTTLISQLWRGQEANVLLNKYNNAFSKSYREHFSPKQAIRAINHLSLIHI